MAKCPVCAKPAAARAVNPAAPFCSDRCKLIDLGKWLGEEYRIPTSAPEEEEDGAPTPRSDDDGDPGHHDA
jgi:endogenous inhibitor of DNA gyrase (YacG/DUF329 family)